MRSLWKGAVSFGLVHIPIKLYTATQPKDVSFNQLHNVCGSRIRYKRFCPHCDVEVSQDDILRGYEYAKDSYVVVSDDEMNELPVAGAKTIEIQQFVRLEEIDPVFFDKTYYIEPAEGGSKAYALLRKALLNTGRIAIATVVLRTKSSLCALRPIGGSGANGHANGGGGALIMETMFYPDEIRSPEALTGIDSHGALREDELTMAEQLIKNLSKPFAPEQYDDEYRAALLALINDKIRGEQVARAPAAAPSAKVADLMEALRASLQATAGRVTNGAPTPAGAATNGVTQNGRQPVTVEPSPSTALLQTTADPGVPLRTNVGPRVPFEPGVVVPGAGVPGAGTPGAGVPAPPPITPMDGMGPPPLAPDGAVSVDGHRTGASIPNPRQWRQPNDPNENQQPRPRPPR